MRLAFALLMVPLAATPACKTDESSPCPQCQPGLACNFSTGQCVPINVNANSCPPPPAACGANASCQTSTCQCNSGFSDCNEDLGLPGGNGCECSTTCDQKICVVPKSCDPKTAEDCGAETSFCNATVCAPCPSGSFNCDGVDDCERSEPCVHCEPDKSGSCDKQQFCADQLCTACPSGLNNCDGIGECECAGPCDGDSCPALPPACLEECFSFRDWHCVKGGAGSNCVECTTDDHCALNPRSYGNRCDTATNFCVCKTDADCVHRTRGSLCKLLGNAKICICDSDADCVAPFTICEGDVFKRCVKPCAVPADCDRGQVQGSCDTSSGRCSFPGGV